MTSSFSLSGLFRKLGRQRTSVGSRDSSSSHAGQYFYLGPHRAITRLRDGHYLYVDPRDDTVCSHLIARGYWESWIHQVVCRLVGPGDHVIEVGANFGYYTVSLAHRVGPTGSLIAFEANPEVAALLTQSVRFNSYQGIVQVLPKAASDTAGVIQFMSSHSNSGGGHIFAFDNALGTGSIVHTVESVRLDDLETPSPKLIRIDAEGSEALILRGAERLLSRPDVIVCMEWDVVQMRTRSSVPELIEWLVAQGFRFWQITEDAALRSLSAADLPGLPGCDLIVSRVHPFEEA